MRTTFLYPLYFLILALPVELSAQHHQIDFSISPTICYRSLDNDPGISHQAGIRYDLEIAYYYQLNNSFQVGTGAGYSRMGFNYSGNYIYANGTEVQDKIKFFRDFMEFPLLLNYTLKTSGRSIIKLNFGLINQWLFSEKTTSLYEPEIRETYSDLKNNGLKTYNIAVRAGISFEKAINSRFHYSLTPFMKYGVLSMNNLHDLSIGLKISAGVNI